MSVLLVEMSPEGCFLSLAAKGKYCQVHPGPEGTVQERPRSRVSSLSPLMGPNTSSWKLYDSKISLNRQKKTPLLSLTTNSPCLFVFEVTGWSHQPLQLVYGGMSWIHSVWDPVGSPVWSQTLPKIQNFTEKTAGAETDPCVKFWVIATPDTCCPFTHGLKSGWFVFPFTWPCAWRGSGWMFLFSKGAGNALSP